MTSNKLIHSTQSDESGQSGRIAIPMLMWIAGVPFTLVFLAWLFFFRGH